MPEYEVVILPQAEKTIRENFQYILETFENEPAAYEHTKDIYQLAKSLKTFPKRFAVYEGYPGREYRVARVRHYRIFYRVDDEERLVYIVDIMHAHQDPDTVRLG